ncbi:MAG: hypothetical protein K0R55_2915 [Sporomusa sp.]|nr:hypothetical protein [Sporomusa sp.]
MVHAFNNGEGALYGGSNLSVLADSHVHTKFSAGAKDDMFDMCETAIVQ